jgi:hypothetical protein
MSVDRLLGPAIARFATLGIVEADDDATRAQKATLTLAAAFITALSTIWVATYLALGLVEAAAIPFAYQVAAIVGLVVFRRSKSYRVFRFSQAAMMTTLPFLLQWVLGGYVASIAVSHWALVASIGTRGRRPADQAETDRA